ncbi:hypothetical protein AB0912_15675 [Streptomyces sp. NPDC007084]|uniref:hypothetical protein n=1 Tax=Streptomyces sp. NPDC007084 TaxID=3154313 RepID=UPI003452CE0C
MDTLTSPTPAPRPGPQTADAPAPIDISASRGPACTLCQRPALVHWLRRPTNEDVEAVRLLEIDRRAAQEQLDNPDAPTPVYPPLPTGADTTVIVHACGPHAIDMEAAAHIHASTCTAPNEADLPGCDCTPEKLPTEPPEETAPLPAHWTSGGQ